MSWSGPAPKPSIDMVKLSTRSLGTGSPEVAGVRGLWFLKFKVSGWYTIPLGRLVRPYYCLKTDFGNKIPYSNSDFAFSRDLTTFSHSLALIGSVSKRSAETLARCLGCVATGDSESESGANFGDSVLSKNWTTSSGQEFTKETFSRQSGTRVILLTTSVFRQREGNGVCHQPEQNHDDRNARQPLFPS